MPLNSLCHLWSAASSGYSCYLHSIQTGVYQTQHPLSILLPDYFTYTLKQLSHPFCDYITLPCLLCFFHSTVPSSFCFAVQTRTQACPLLKPLVPSSTELIRCRLQIHISVHTTQVPQKWHLADSTAALPWLKTDLLSHLIWEFTAVRAGCSFLTLFKNCLAGRLKLSVKPACRECALGSGSQRSNCRTVNRAANTKAQPQHY